MDSKRMKKKKMKTELQSVLQHSKSIQIFSGVENISWLNKI
jgi:hypothetical protein